MKDYQQIGDFLRVANSLNVFMNSSVILLIITQRKLRRQISVLILLNVSLTYLIANGMVFLSSVQPKTFTVHHIQTSITPFFVSLVFLTFDRFCAIRFPFYYSQLSLKKTVSFVYFTSWSFMLLAFLVPLGITLANLILMALTLVTLLCCNTYVYYVARAQCLSILKLQTAGNRGAEVQKEYRLISCIMRAAWTSFSSTIIYILGSGLHFVVTILSIVKGKSYIEFVTLNHWNFPILATEGLVIPIVIVMMNKDLKCAFITLCRRRSRRRKFMISYRRK